MKINCLHCGHGFRLDEYTYQDYEGILRCGTCAGLLDVRIEEGILKACRPGSLTPPPAPAPQQQVQIPQHAPAPAPAPAPVHTGVPAQGQAHAPAEPEQHEAEQQLDDIMRMADELTDNN